MAVASDPLTPDVVSVGLPFAGTELRVELLFHGEDGGDTAPDAIWPASDDLPHDPDSFQLVAGDWRADEERHRLVNYLHRLLAVYKNRQLEQLAKHPAAEAVYRSLVESGFPERNLQVHCGFKTKKIQISAQLDIGRADVRDLPPPDGGGGDDDIDFGTASAALIFTVAPADGAVSTCCLSLSPYVERVLDGRLDFNHLPYPGSVDGRFLAEAGRWVGAALTVVGAEFVERRRLLAALMDLYGEGVVEHDGRAYRHATLLVTVDGLRCLVRCSLSRPRQLILVAPDVQLVQGVAYSESCPLEWVGDDGGDEPATNKHLEAALNDAFTFHIQRFASNATSYT